MDDFSVSSLHESKNEWGARLLIILTPLIVEGFRSIFDESLKLCRENNEMDKYLMTFQNFITRIPKWNATIIENERKRIIEKSHCSYLEELVTCIHIIQLKLLTAMRVGPKQRKIDINIPKLDDFIHKCYIGVAKKIYTNVYLFELANTPLQKQKNARELEIIVQECILNAVRESIPIESILKAYMDETVEDVVEETKEQIVEPPAASLAKAEAAKAEEALDPVVSFTDIDAVLSSQGESMVEAPKNVERLEEISALRSMQRKLDNAALNNPMDEEDTIHISDEFAPLDVLNIQPLSTDSMPALDLSDFESLD